MVRAVILRFERAAARIEAALYSARTWSRPAAVAAAALITAGASAAAAAQPGIAVPPQAFPHAHSRSKPIVKWRPDDSHWDRERSSDQAHFLVSVPVGARAREPLTVRLHWAEPESGVTTAAEDEDDDFIHDATAR